MPMNLWCLRGKVWGQGSSRARVNFENWMAREDSKQVPVASLGGVGFEAAALCDRHLLDAEQQLFKAGMGWVSSGTTLSSTVC